MGDFYNIKQMTEWAEWEGYTFEWEDDWHVGSHVEEFDAYDEEPSECEILLMKDKDGGVVQSLGCIDDADDDYRAQCVADLAYQEWYDKGRPQLLPFAV